MPERPAFVRIGRAAVLTGDGRIGLLSITDVNRVLQALELAGGRRPRDRTHCLIRGVLPIAVWNPAGIATT
jgi:hypothetical protein